MPLTFRQNGSGSQNLVTAQWWNDYYNLLTGAMNDQAVKINHSLQLKPSINIPATPTLSAVSGTGLNQGTYTYGYTFVDGNGAESPMSGTVQIATTSTNKKVNVTLHLGGSGVMKRNIYRSKVGATQLYFLVTVNDNTTTTYADTAADTTLTTLAPTDGSHGGLLFRDINGFLQGYITPSSGRLGVIGLNNIQFQVPGGNLIAQIDSGGLHVNNGLSINSGSITFPPANGNNFPFEIATGPITYLRTGNTGFGIKDAGTARLLELRNSGDLLISGRYMTTQSSFTTVAGQSFDSFDYAEIYECDQSYPNGTVVCPGEHNQMVRCTHDNCPCASVISYCPGFQIGQENHASGTHPIALCGRVNVKTAYEIPYRALVVSDGRGGVRQLKADEWGFALGFTLNEALHGQVGIFIRSTYCKG